MTESINNKIIEALAEIKKEEKVCVVYACESGSRAWGFPSINSDYDVRFLYIRHKNWYLTLEEGRDVIERFTDDKIDLCGWDIRKALRLFKKSNPPILEWLQSPIVYLEEFTVAQELRSLLSEFYSPIACRYHYLHMAQGNFRDYLQEDIVWTKKYFYVLRPILACKWIEADLGPVPMEFKTLVDRLIDSSTVKHAIYDLLDRKQQGDELARGPKIQVLSDFIKLELEKLMKEKFIQSFPAYNSEKLDQLFRSSLIEVWK